VVGLSTGEMLSAVSFARACIGNGARNRREKEILEETERVLAVGRLGRSPVITDPRWARLCPELMDRIRAG